MVLRLLGPVELVHDGRSLDVGGPRQRVVLAMLGLNINRTTSTEQLIDAVWGDRPPTTARGQIQVAISTLRKQFAQAGRAHAITTRAPGYALELDTGSVDSLEFDRLATAAREDARAGRIQKAAATLRTALELWRGPALDGVPSDATQRAAAHLNDRRLAVLEERIRLDLMLARHEEVCAELTALIGRHPLWERLYELLMLALYSLMLWFSIPINTIIVFFGLLVALLMLLFMRWSHHNIKTDPSLLRQIGQHGHGQALH